MKFKIILNPGWNVVKLPADPVKPDASDVFPTALSVNWWDSDRKMYRRLKPPENGVWQPVFPSTVYGDREYQVAVEEQIEYEMEIKDRNKTLIIAAVLVSGLVIMSRKR